MRDMSDAVIVCYSVGSKIKLGEISAQVTGIWIRSTGNNPHISYEVAWWVEGQRYTAWVEPEEITSDLESFCKVGYCSIARVRRMQAGAGFLRC